MSETDWFETASGQMCDPHAEEPAYTAGDLILGMARTCRFGGQLRNDVEFYSVVEHCWLLTTYAFKHVPNLGYRELRTLAMHDAAEGIIGDIIRPLKRVLPDYRYIEEKIEADVARRFDLIYPWPDFVKELDTRILKDEREQVMCTAAGNKWAVDDLEPLGVKCRGWPPFIAVNHYHQLLIVLGVKDFHKERGLCV